MKPSSFRKASRRFTLAAMTFITAALNSSAQESISSGLNGFIENKGQIHDQNYVCNTSVLYMFSSPGLNVSLKKNGFSYDTWTLNEDQDRKNNPLHYKKGMAIDDKTSANFHRVDITFAGASANVEIIPEGKSKSFANYYTAGTPESGVLDVHSYSRILYKNLYPGIDVEFVQHPDQKQQVEYNFIVHPGADPSVIRMQYSGAENISLMNNRISIETSNGVMEENIPESYWQSTHENVDVQYTLHQIEPSIVEIGFAKVNMKPGQTLIIDPVPYVGWGTYFGGSASEIIYDIQLEFFCGSTLSTSSIATAGVHQTIIAGMRDGFAGRYYANTGTIFFVTYYGGSQNDEAFGLSVSVLNSPGLYITGVTNSTSGIASAGAYDATYDGAGDAFVAAFNMSTGTRIFGTYYGGAGADQGNGIAVSISYAQPAIVFCGTTTTNSGTAIASASSHQSVYGGGTSDGFIASISNNGTTRNYGTYIGGTLTDQLNDCAYASTTSSNVAFCGNTSSTSGIAVGASVDNTYNGGGSDGMVGKINPTTGVVDFLGYSGGALSDQLLAIDYDGSGSNGIRVGGLTNSTSGIATAGAYQASFAGGIFDGYTQSYDVGSGYMSSGTYYGGPGDDMITGVLTGSSSTTFSSSWGCTFTGFTSSTTGIATVGSHDNSLNGGTDAFVAQLINNPSVRVFGTYVGGAGNDYAQGIGFYNPGAYVIAGQTQSTTGISTAGTHQPAYGGGTEDAFLIRIDGCQGVGYPSGLVAGASATTICAGTTVTLSVTSGDLNGANNYYWYSGSCGSAVIDSGATITQTPTVTTTYYVTKGSWYANCSYFACGTPVTVTVNSVNVAASASSPTICSGNSTTLTASGASTYSWMPGSLSGSSVSVSPTSTTTYTVTGTGANGCTNTNTVAITVNTSPTVSTTASTVTICNGSSVTLSGSGASTYNWQPGNLNGSPVTVSPSSTTTYTVVGTAANGCTGTSTRTITVLTTPTVTVSSPTTICSGNSTNLTSSGASTYSWMPGSLSGSSVTVSPTSTTTYSVTGTSANGCTASNTVMITVNTSPTVTATASTVTICSGSSVTITGGGASTYSWQPGSLNGTSVTVSPTVTTTYSVTGTAANGCTGTATSAITVLTTPNVTVSSPTTICIGDFANLIASGASTYAWSPGAMTNSNVMVAPIATTTYTVTGTAANGCTAQASTTVTVNQLPNVTASASSNSICDGSPVTLTANGATNYLWQPGSLSGSPQILNPAVSTTYTLTGTDANGCSNTATTSVTVNTLPTVSASYTASAIGCEGETFTLDATGAATYDWQPGNLSGAQIVQTMSTSVTYTITGTDNNGCTDTTVMAVQVFPNPVVVANATDTAVCAGTSITLFGSGAQSGSYIWDNGVTDSIAFVPSTTLTYVVTTTNVNGCTASDQITVNVASLPDTSVTLSMDQITLNANQNGASYQWINCASGLPINGATSQSYMATANGSYAVIVDLGGCPDTSGCHLIQSVGIDESDNNDLNVYPNPVASTLNITGAEINSTVLIYNSLGQIVVSETVNSHRMEIDFTSMPAGVYSVHVAGSQPVIVVHTR